MDRWYLVNYQVARKSKLMLVDTAVSKQVESHVHGFGMFGLDMTVDDALGSAVVVWISVGG